MLKFRMRAAHAVVFAALLCASATRTVRCDEFVAPSCAASVSCTDRLPAALAASPCADEPLPWRDDAPALDIHAPRASCVTLPAGESGSPSAAAPPRAPRVTLSPALHTATHARALHHRLHHEALAYRHAGRRHPTPELRAHRPSVRSAGNTPAPAAPARESHPRAALPVLVRAGHHSSTGGGSRLLGAAWSGNWTLPVTATRVAFEQDARIHDTGHEVNAARGPPATDPLEPRPPAIARRPFLLPRARLLRDHPDSVSRPALRFGSGVFRRSPVSARRPCARRAGSDVSPALSHDGADAGRRESRPASLS